MTHPLLAVTYEELMSISGMQLFKLRSNHQLNNSSHYIPSVIWSCNVLTHHCYGFKLTLGSLFITQLDDSQYLSTVYQFRTYFNSLHFMLIIDFTNLLCNTIGTCLWSRISPGICLWPLDFWHLCKSAKNTKITAQVNLKWDFGVLIAQSSIKLNEMNTHSSTWIFASNNGISHHIPDIYTGNQCWCQNIINLKKIMDVF